MIGFPSIDCPSWRRFLAVLLVVCSAAGQAADQRSLAQRLGYGPGDRLLIVNGDDAGMCQAANTGTIECLEKGLMRSATIMVPCPWFPQIATYAKTHPETDFGIHLCHTSEWGNYRWGPVAPRDQVPGLVDPDGYLWREPEQVYAHANPTQALAEARAQIQRALASGIDVTHFDSHMGTLQLNPEYVKIYLALAVEFDLPVRMASQDTLARHNQPDVRAEFSKEGICFPDYLVYDELANETRDVKSFWLGVVKNLKPGVTELFIHAAAPTEELKSITSTAGTRSAEADLFTRDEELKRVIHEQKVILIGYRLLRDLQRHERRGKIPSVPKR